MASEDVLSLTSEDLGTEMNSEFSSTHWIHTWKRLDEVERIHELSVVGITQNHVYLNSKSEINALIEQKYSRKGGSFQHQIKEGLLKIGSTISRRPTFRREIGSLGSSSVGSDGKAKKRGRRNRSLVTYKKKAGEVPVDTSAMSASFLSKMDNLDNNKKLEFDASEFRNRWENLDTLFLVKKAQAPYKNEIKRSNYKADMSDDTKTDQNAELKVLSETELEEMKAVILFGRKEAVQETSELLHKLKDRLMTLSADPKYMDNKQFVLYKSKLQQESIMKPGLQGRENSALFGNLYSNTQIQPWKLGMHLEIRRILKEHRKRVEKTRKWEEKNRQKIQQLKSMGGDLPDDLQSNALLSAKNLATSQMKNLEFQITKVYNKYFLHNIMVEWHNITKEKK